MRALVVIALLFRVAAADPDPGAATHYKQGKVFLDAKQYDLAIVEFDAAYAIDKVPSHLFNIAKAYDAKNDYDKAIDYYNRYLVAEPKSSRAAEVRNAVLVATQARDAARKAAEVKRLEEEQAKNKLLAASHVKQAEAYAQSSAWVDAGVEHLAAFGIDSDPAHLLAAADAFLKAPDLKKARDAYLVYVEKVPTGGESERVRVKLAETQKAIEKADEDDRLRKQKEAQEQAERDRRDRLPTQQNQPPKIEFDTTARDHRRSTALKVLIPGAIVTAGGLAVGFLALQEKSKGKSNCDRAFVCDDDGIRHLDNAHKFARIADIALGLGLAGTITGIVLFGNAPKAVRKGVEVTPIASPTAAGVMLRGAF